MSTRTLTIALGMALFMFGALASSAATLRLSRRAAGLLRTGGAAFELTARMPGGRTGRGTVRLGRPKP